MFNDYSKIASDAKYKSVYWQGLKILTPKQTLQRLPITLAQVKVGNNSENLLNANLFIKLFIKCVNQKKLLKKYTIT